MTDKIDLVTASDIQRVAARIFGPHSGGKPTVVVQGHEDVKDWKDTFRQYGLASA
jgi:processing peptidase subunit alpha